MLGRRTADGRGGFPGLVRVLGLVGGFARETIRRIGAGIVVGVGGLGGFRGLGRLLGISGLLGLRDCLIQVQA